MLSSHCIVIADNGPEYDSSTTTIPGPGPLTYNATTGHLSVYSVQATAHFLADVEALITIANATGRTSVISRLAERATIATAALNEHLWDDVAGIYTNALFNGSFYPRRSPTAFYPLIAGVASDTQAARCMDFLTSPEYFCVTKDHRGPPNTTRAVHYYSPRTNGSILCGSEECMRNATDSGEFYWGRVEALLWAADNSSLPPGALPLSTWRNAV